MELARDLAYEFASRESILLGIVGKRKNYASAGKLIARDAPPDTEFLLIRGAGQLRNLCRVRGLARSGNLH